MRNILLKLLPFSLMVMAFFTFINSASAAITDTKWVEDQMSSNYNDGKYKGTLTRYLAGGELIPPHTKIGKRSSPGWSEGGSVCRLSANGGYYGWVATGTSGTDQQGPYDYSDADGYEGSIPRVGYDVTFDNGPPSGSCDESNVGATHVQRREYIAYWEGPVTKPGMDTRYYRYRGWVEAVVEDPSNDKEEPGTTEGSTSGQAYWELVRNNGSTASDVETLNLFTIAGKHYATRNMQHESKLAGRTGTTKLTVPGLEAKGKPFEYLFSYEYTNHYREVYKCTDNRSDGCYAWVYVEDIPAWNHVKTYTLKDKILVDSRQEDTVKKPTIEELLQEKWLVGREHLWKSSVKTEKAYYEQWKKAASNDRKSMNNLKTQTTLPITPGALVYEVEVPSGGHLASDYNVLRREKSFGHYFPADVDDSLKEAYKNETKYSEFKYAYPLQQAVQKDNGVSGGKRVQEWDYGTDLFFMTKYTGFSVGTPYAAMLKANIADGVWMPTHGTLMNDGKAKIASAFTNTTGQTFVDDVLYTDSESEMDRLQRYAIPISPDSPLKPNTTYQNHLVLDNMGLNDAVFEFDQSFLFEHYLFGSGYDEAWIIEQPDARPVKMNQMNPSDVHTIVIEDADKAELVEVAMSRPKDKMHRLRVTDRDLVDKIKGIVGDFGW